MKSAMAVSFPHVALVAADHQHKLVRLPSNMFGVLFFENWMTPCAFRTSFHTAVSPMGTPPCTRGGGF